MDQELLNSLVCPVCLQPLVLNKERQELVCQYDKLAYPIRDNIPVLLKEQARTLTNEEDDNQ